MKNSILHFDTSTINRLKQPEVEPLADGNKVKKGSLLKFKYPDSKITNVFFKFSFDPNILPSYFSGELYSENLGKTLDKDCEIKVCSCKKGYKDSKILTLRYIINNDDEEQVIRRELGKGERKDMIERPSFSLDSGKPIISPQASSELSPKTVSRPGTSTFEPKYINGNCELDDDDDGFP